MNIDRRILFAGCCAALAMAGSGRHAHAADPTPSEPLSSEWRSIRSAIATDRKLEARIDRILADMTLRQKIGQMTQAEIKSSTPEEGST